MFAVLFEVHPAADRWEAYLEQARLLRPELEQIDGFVDNLRYRSLTRDGWLLSLSNWRDEKSLVRWRTTLRHHEAQVQGRAGVLADYHLRVGQLTQDTQLPPGQRLLEQRLDETEVGDGTTVTLVDAHHAAGPPLADPAAAWLGLNPAADGLVGWDVFDAVLAPGDVVLLMTWRTAAHAAAFGRDLRCPPGGRSRQVRVVRDYGRNDRREAPQYYPPVPVPPPR